MSKQDRQGARTINGLEQKYGFGKTFAEVMEIATDARKTATETRDSLDEKLTQDEIFNILTDNGRQQGLYRGEDGELYINAEYVRTGILKSKDGKTVSFDLDNGNFVITKSDGTQRVVMDATDCYKLQILKNGVFTDAFKIFSDSSGVLEMLATDAISLTSDGTQGVSMIRLTAANVVLDTDNVVTKRPDGTSRAVYTGDVVISGKTLKIVNGLIVSVT